MLTEDQFISYFEKLANAHRTIAHNLDGQQSFFEVEDPDELSAFNEALRYATGSTVMLLVAGEGELDDNNSENHVQVVDFQIYILQKKETDVKTSDIRSVCIEVIKSIVGRTKHDCRRGRIVPGKSVNFRIENVPIRMVGPIELNWYGYTTQLSFTCPFGWSVDSGTWTDIP
jgi:hypothetical protein